jgi:hypothetical protein
VDYDNQCRWGEKNGILIEDIMQFPVLKICHAYGITKDSGPLINRGLHPGLQICHPASGISVGIRFKFALNIPNMKLDFIIALIMNILGNLNKFMHFT